MANFHSRSNSFPLQSHPMVDDVQEHLCRLKSSEATSTSTSTISICSNLSNLRDLHDSINNMIQMPSTQQALSQNWIDELLEGSLKTVDLCGLSRDVVCLTKESVQDLESSVRRNKGEMATSDDIKSYVSSRKKINKMIKKIVKNLKSFKQNSTTLPDNEFGKILKEAEALDTSVLKSILILLSGEKKQHSWSLISKFTQTSRVHSETEDSCSLNIHKSPKEMANISLKQLNTSEMVIQEIEEGLEALFRSLVKTRVSLLNVLSH